VDTLHLKNGLFLLAWTAWTICHALICAFNSSLAPFGCADKPTEKYCWLIYCERKTLFWLKKQAEKYGL
jgi:hypothetical protein